MIDMKMKSGRKKYVIILIILSIYLGIIFVLFYNKKEKSMSIVIDNHAFFRYTKADKWINIKLSNEVMDDYNWNKYKIYVNNNYFDNQYLWYNDKWYIFDNDKQPINYSGNLLAVRSDFDKGIDVANFFEQEIKDYSYVYKVLNKKNITFDSNYTVKSFIDFDIDQDGISEQIYVISNAFPIDFSASKYYSYVFMVKNNKIYHIYGNTFNDMYDACKAYVSGIIDIDNDNKYEVIVNCGKYSNKGTVVSVYKFNNRKFEKVISNE